MTIQLCFLNRLLNRADRLLRPTVALSALGLVLGLGVGLAPCLTSTALAHVNQDGLPIDHVNQDNGEGEEPPEATKGRQSRREKPIQGDVFIDVVPCPGDVDGNGVIAFEDMFEILQAWGACTGCDADLDADGNVNMQDLSVVLNGWGSTCTG